MNKNSFHPEHLSDLRRSGLTDETIRAARIYTVPPGEIGKKLGGGDAGVVSAYGIPYPGVEGFERLRCFYDEGKTGPKYRQSPGTTNHLYCPPTINLAGAEPLIIAEGEKKTLKLAQEGFPAVGIGGVWNWCERAEGYNRPKQTKPIPDFDRVNWRRTVTILFDSDGHDNRNVRLAAFRLARELSQRGATVFLLFIPPSLTWEKQGVDDFLVAHGPQALETLLKTAWTFNPAWSDAEAEIAWQTKDLTPQTPLHEKLKRLAALTPTLARLSNMEAAAILEELRARLKLRGEDLAGFKVDLRAARKANGGKGEGGTKANGEPKYTANFPGLVDIVATEEGPAFLVVTPDGPTVAPTWEVEGQVVQPPPADKLPWALPRAAEVLRHIKEAEPPERLFADLINHFAGVSELPTPAYHVLQAAWVFHTYLPEVSHYSPEICLYAVPERGKSRTGKAMIYIARRGVQVESLRDAYLVRLANDCQAALFFDCMNLWQKAEKAGCEDIILGRFERGIKVPRVLYPERGPHRDTVFYDIFGPTLIATNVAVHHILDTRAIQINMPQAQTACYEAEVTSAGGLPFKERLTAWRARFLGKPMPDCQKPAPGRLGDILKPLLQIVLLVAPAYEGEFRDLINDIQRRRLTDKATSLEAQIVLVVADLEAKVVKGILPVKLIADTFNEGRPDREQITYQRMGRKLRSLGFEPAQTGDSAAAIVWDRLKVMQILSAYGLRKTSETSETSENCGRTNQAPPDDTDVSDDTDVFERALGSKKTSPFSAAGQGQGKEAAPAGGVDDDDDYWEVCI
jgi:hypothetical protein